MSKTNEKKLIPKLRFHEFQNDAEWEAKKLIDFADKNVKWSFTGGPFGSNLKASDYTENGVRIIQLQNIGDGQFLDDYKIYTSVEKANELLSCNIYSGDIILSKMGDPVGRACIIPGINDRFIMASDGIRLVVDEKRFSKYFIYSLINSAPIREKIEKKATGSTRKRIGLDDLREIEMFSPKKVEEQQKIAECLSSLDEVITAECQKLEALKEHKKGLLQNLFPQEGETVPKLRFKEFENSGDWEEKKLGEQEVSSFINGKVPIKNLRLESYVSTENILPDFAGKTIASRLPPSGSFTKFIEGDILISNIRPYLKKVWKANTDGAASNDVIVLRAGIKVIKEFLEFLIKNEAFINYIMKSAKGVKMPRGDKSSMQEYPVMIPSLCEQKKIASCLLSLEDIINAQYQKVEALKLHKKGLLQGLFPDVNGENE